ncbi:MAG: malto-oligosyltrehalose trehalohydrolase [Phycisphaerales bacterium]
MRPELPQLGARWLESGLTRFVVWAPHATRLALRLSDTQRREWMTRDNLGYHSIELDAPPGTFYQFEFEDGRFRPDPASRAQPLGVHGPSMVTRPALPSPSPFHNPDLHYHVIYELHAGTFTPEGTFQSAITRLDHLRSLGVTAIQLMPIAQFPGGRNWGYDGVAPFAAQWSYGGLEGLLALIDACHERGLAIFLDVVFNHLGPEGNYLADFGPYFTDRYRTPWGSALNFDGPDSDHVRELFIQCALQWTADLGFDALRLDAVHAIFDHTARSFLEELTQRVHDAGARQGRRILIIAESSDNDPRLVRPREVGGVGMDGCWNDDFHHALRSALTGENRGYYRPFGSVSQIAKALRDRYVFCGEYSAGYRRRHGAPGVDIPHGRLIVYTQNHDQVGNRPQGDRLDAAAGDDGARVAAMLTLLSPFTPMLWMGEEYGERAPFAYFVSHTDPGLIEAVRTGRRAEFAELHESSDPLDPQDEQTFQGCRLRWDAADTQEGARRLNYYRALLSLRREIDVPSLASESRARAWEVERCVAIWYGEPARLIVAANLGVSAATICLPESVAPAPISFRIAIDSSHAQWWTPDAQPPALPSSLSAEAEGLRLGLAPRSCMAIVTDGAAK